MISQLIIHHNMMSISMQINGVVVLGVSHSFLVNATKLGSLQINVTNTNTIFVSLSIFMNYMIPSTVSKSTQSHKSHHNLKHNVHTTHWINIYLYSMIFHHRIHQSHHSCHCIYWFSNL